MGNMADHGKLHIVWLDTNLPQLVNPRDLRVVENVVDDPTIDQDAGPCDICGRSENLLLFHHLIPRSMHVSFIGKKLPEGITGEPTKNFLQSHGCRMCQQCHNVVHNVGTDMEMAENLSTLDKLKANPMVVNWVNWATGDALK